MRQRSNLLWLPVVSALMTLLMPVVCRAEHTRYWEQTDFSDFQKGSAQGVAVSSDGSLTLAPKFEAYADPNLAYVWALRVDSLGRLYAAGGSDAKVIRFDAAAKPTTVFESSELAAQAIALDPKDNLYVGTSPDGKVYKVTPEGQKSVFFEPNTKYIWALAFDAQGDLFVATGDKGQVFVVTPDGKGQLFYQSREQHARSLAFDAKGRLLIGTDPDGLVLRVEIVRKDSKSEPVAGAVFAVYETNKAEVTSLVEDASGNLYAASIGDKTRTLGSFRMGFPSVAPQVPVSPGVSQSIVVSQAPTQLPQAGVTPSFPAFPVAGGAEVVKIAPDGSPITLWMSREDLVFAAGLSPSGQVLLGTGNNGALIALEGRGVFARIATTASAQVMSLAAGPDGRMYVATANPGKIFVLGPGLELSGSFASEPFDAKIFSAWGRLTWWAENASSENGLEFYIRSGNTSNPEENWSSWAGPYKKSGQGPAGCPSARFVQWKAVWSGASKGAAPRVTWVTLAYLPKNVAPVIDDIAVQEPGIRVVGFAANDGTTTPTPVQLRYPRTSRTGASLPSLGAEVSSRQAKAEAPLQGSEQKGFQSVLWSAHDDNADDLTYAVYYRGEGENHWRLLKDKLTQRYYSWDTTTMPDGAYYLKIVASDAPSNPAGQELQSERESDRFLVANTPPRIENLRADAGASGAKISFDAASPSTTISEARYSLDAGEWQTVFPADSLSDAAKESYVIGLSGLPAGEHTLAVQITDLFENTTAAKVTFTVAAGGSH